MNRNVSRLLTACCLLSLALGCASGGGEGAAGSPASDAPAADAAAAEQRLRARITSVLEDPLRPEDDRARDAPLTGPLVSNSIGLSA